MSTIPTPAAIIDQTLAGTAVPDHIRQALIQLVTDCVPVDERELGHAPMVEGVHYYGHQIGETARRRTT